jgi:uncharacterized protein related to proFAR isomerase
MLVVVTVRGIAVLGRSGNRFEYRLISPVAPHPFGSSLLHLTGDAEERLAREVYADVALLRGVEDPLGKRRVEGTDPEVDAGDA